MDERDLVGLLYRADWTRLALTGTVRGARWVPDTTFTHHWRAWETGPRSHRFPLPDPPRWMTDSTDEPPGAQRSLVLAPGRRYRVTRSDGSRVIGCDGERGWQWFANLPPDTEVRFNHRPEPPVPELLAPVWLLLGFRLTVGAETTVAGRPGIVVTGVARTSPWGGLVGTTLLPWGFVRRPDRVTAVIDAELGIVLRCELWSTDAEADADADVTEFLSLAVGDAGDASVFAAPTGSFFGDGPSGERASDRRPVDEVGRAALKMVGGLAAGGLGVAVKCLPDRRADPFAAATAEDPDDAMPDDEPLPPGWTADCTDGADGGAPVGDEVLELLYRGGLEPGPIGGTMHQWTDFDAMGDAMLRAVPESARRAGFGGVGFLVDTILADDRDAGFSKHAVDRVRVGAWDRYRVDHVRRALPTSARKPRRLRDDSDALTVACDGEQTFTVFDDEVLVGPASVLDERRHGDLLQLLDGSWLLMHRLSGGEVVEIDGRTGYRIIATAGPGPALGVPLTWLPAWWLPAVAVVDASSGRLLRLTRYRDGKVTMRLELRSLSDGGSDDWSDDFGFTPPEGLPVVDEPEPRFSRVSGDDETEFFGTDDLQVVVDTVKEQVDAKLLAARGFLGSFLRGR
jgi:hypothetical protein